MRLVVHLGLPLNVVDYYQQIGRAGCDGGKAKAVIIYDEGLMSVNRALIKGSPKDARSWMKTQQDTLEKIVTGDGCIMCGLLEHLGETREKPCGHCTICQRNRRDR